MPSTTFFEFKETEVQNSYVTHTKQNRRLEAYSWVVIRIYHPHDPNVAIQSRSELPLMQPGEIWFRRISIACTQRQIAPFILGRENTCDTHSRKGFGRKLT